MTKLAAEAGIPLVYVNRQPADVDAAGEGRLRRLRTKSNPARSRPRKSAAARAARATSWCMMGELSNQAARQRTKDIHDVIADAGVRGHQDRRRADRQLVAHPGHRPDDQLDHRRPRVRRRGLQQRRDGDRRHPGPEGCRLSTWTRSIVGGVDATQDALAAMKAGDLDVTVFQNAAGQGQGAVDAALKLAKGEKVETKVWVPFELVTPANMDSIVVQELTPALRASPGARRCWQRPASRACASSLGEDRDMTCAAPRRWQARPRQRRRAGTAGISARGRGRPQGISGRAGARQCPVPAEARHRACADGRERRRQIDADEDHRRHLSRPIAARSSLRGQDIRLNSPLDALENGIAMIHQELNLMPSMTVAENIWIRREPKNALRLRRSRRDAPT